MVEKITSSPSSSSSIFIFSSHFFLFWHLPYYSMRPFCVFIINNEICLDKKLNKKLFRVGLFCYNYYWYATVMQLFHIQHTNIRPQTSSFVFCCFTFWQNLICMCYVSFYLHHLHFLHIYVTFFGKTPFSNFTFLFPFRQQYLL